jgi:response regulator RpfG family c-di-GMP phosphodiesterase
MSLSVSVVTNEKRVFNSHHQVSEIATEIRNYLRRLPGSNFYFDRRDNCLTTMPSLTAKGIPLAYREELKALQGTTAWVAFLTKELETPVTAIQNYLDSQLQTQVQVFDTPGTTGLETIREHVGQLIRTVDGLRHLGELDCDIANTTVMKVDLTTTLDWVISQLEGLAHQQGIRINCAGDQDVRWLMIDGRSLAQGLFYLIRSEIKSAVRGDHLQIHVSETSEEFVSVEVINANRYIPPHELAMLFRGQLENLISNGERNDLYLAKVSVKGFGGELSIDSRKGEGCISSIHIPKQWRSSVGDVSRLQSEVENIAEIVRSKVEALHCLLPSIVEQVPSDFEAVLDILTAQTQELEVVCNRALFLADGLTSELDNHQGLVLRQELEQLATSEAMLVANREIARLTQTEEHLFDPESAKRVAKNVLAIADELKLSRSERQSIYYAALLKDLGLISAPQAMVELNLVPTIEKALSYRHHFNSVEKAVSRLNYLAPAISIAKQRYERYDGTGYPSGLKGAKIPLGARILAVVDAFDSMTSGLSKHSLKPERAAKEIAAESGRRFDPRVTGVFLQVWRRGELQVASHKLRLEVSSL